MVRLFVAALGLTLPVNVNCQKSYSGEYQTNFSTYGMFGKTLKLNCDSTAILNFRGDLMNDNSYGRWKIEQKNLIIYFDTANKTSRYKDILTLKAKGYKLFQISWTMDHYKRLKNKLDSLNEATGKHDKLPQYRRFKKMMNKTPKNFSGKTGRQFFRKIKEYQFAD